MAKILTSLFQNTTKMRPYFRGDNIGGLVCYKETHRSFYYFQIQQTETDEQVLL